MRSGEWNVPLTREIHIWSIGLEVFNETDTNDVALVVLEEKTDALKTARIACPASRTRDAAWELLRSVSIRHASRKLKFRLKGG